MVKPDITTEQMVEYCSDIIHDGGYNTQVPMWEAIRARLSEYDALLAEVREWICESCNTVYPGPPQKGLACIVCPKCEGRTRPRGQAERDALKAEVERLQRQVGIEQRKVSDLEGLLVKYRKASEEAEDELEVARPLLEVVEKADVFQYEDGSVGFEGDMFQPILKAALAYRAAKEKK